MIHQQVSQAIDPVNQFIFSHIHFILIICAVLILIRCIFILKGLSVKKRADRIDAVNTNEWFKI